MDFKKWFTNNKWIVLLLVYLAALILQFISKGWSALPTSAVIGLIVAIVATTFNNSREVKRLFRKIKYFLGFGMFKWEATSVFTVKKTMFKNSREQEEILRKIAKECLEDNDIDTKKSDSIQTSFDKAKNLKLFIEAYVMYLDISVTDADSYDDDGDELVYVTIKTKASLRYKDNNKAINGVLLDFYYRFEKKYSPQEQKYTVQIQPENMSKDFLTKNFINEFYPNEVSSFNITSKQSKSTIETVSHKLLSLTTDRREELNNSIKNLILKLS
ncbi:hypothetical protein [Priestia flexa]|uniref:Uncharacterized protein n=1 Tax=Priestia flexa TaxID=86664 RepID=A0A8I1MK97_9BACI|nr:hypothetical protein [Priestia flexa]MBN8253861.1 hypothetical protein [Priestia flexa]